MIKHLVSGVVITLVCWATLTVTFLTLLLVMDKVRLIECVWK